MKIFLGSTRAHTMLIYSFFVYSYNGIIGECYKDGWDRGTLQRSSNMLRVGFWTLYSFFFLLPVTLGFLWFALQVSAHRDQRTFFYYCWQCYAFYQKTLRIGAKSVTRCSHEKVWEHVRLSRKCFCAGFNLRYERFLTKLFHIYTWKIVHLLSSTKALNRNLLSVIDN